jgi:predicted 3-demethylubiquinone-9 3-methyltransferase (glyoxalase superfamily)
MTSIAPCLWFKDEALEAAHFYTGIFPESAITQVHHAAIGTPGAATGRVLFVEFRLAGRPYQALNGGMPETYTNAVSMSAVCADQAEVDRLWDALTADGGKPVMCGWCKDKYGLSWQVVPRRMLDLLSDPDRARAARAMTAMVGMIKLDLAAIEAAADAA